LTKLNLDPNRNEHQGTEDKLSCSEKPGEDGLENHGKAELIQVDLHETVSQRLLLYERRFAEAGD